MNIPRVAVPLSYIMVGGEKWGYYVSLQGVDHSMPMYPQDDKSCDWPTPEAARTAAVEALRSLADRIEKGEP